MPLPEPLIVPFGYRLKEQYRNGLVGHWKCNVNSGIILPDLSGNRNHGTLTNMANPPTATSGWAGQVLRFNGTDNYVDAGSGASLNVGNILTLSAWIKPTSVSVRQTIIGHNDEAGTFQLEFGYTSGEVAVIISGVFIARTNSSIISANQWTHITYTRSGTGSGTHKIYVNGVSQTLTTDASNNFVNPTQPTQIGRRLVGNANFNGLIDDVRIYNRALSAGEVAHAYFQQEDEWDLGLDDDIDVTQGVPIELLQSGNLM
jgi:hypothetical protein